MAEDQKLSGPNLNAGVELSKLTVNEAFLGQRECDELAFEAGEISPVSQSTSRCVTGHVCPHAVSHQGESRL